MSIVTVKDLLHAGVHFGHQKRFWNPKMEQYIFDTRKQISIINLDITLEQINAAASKVEDICSKGNKVLFVGTKRSASKTIQEEATALGLPYVNKRWLGGTLTNWKTIRGSVRRLQDIEEMVSSGKIEKLIKKEAVDMQKEHTKLEASVGGIKDMKGLPDAIFVVDVKYEKIAVLEARKMGIPVIALVDTNSDPDDPNLRKLILQGLVYAISAEPSKEPDPVTDIRDIPYEYKYLADAQNSLGWYNLWYGRYHLEWDRYQRRYLTLVGETDDEPTGEPKWIRAVTLTIWRHCHK